MSVVTTHLRMTEFIPKEDINSRPIEGVVVSKKCAIKHGQLKDISGVRKEMCLLYREIKRGERPVEDGPKITYVLKEIAKLIEMEQIETRIATLESKMNRIVRGITR